MIAHHVKEDPVEYVCLIPLSVKNQDLYLGILFARLSIMIRIRIKSGRMLEKMVVAVVGQGIMQSCHDIALQHVTGVPSKIFRHMIS